MEIDLEIAYELKSLCYLNIVLAQIRNNARLTEENFITENYVKETYLQKQYELSLQIEMLPLPNCLIRELSLLLNKIFSEIQYFWDSNSRIGIAGEAHILDTRNWNLDGSLNEKKIAKAISQDSKINKCQRFVLAFHNCLEEEAALLWDQLSLPERVEARSSGVRYFRKNIFMFMYLENKSFYTDVNALSFRLRNVEDERKIEKVLNLAKQENMIPKIMRFCLSLLNPEQQKEICIKNPGGVLRALLTWPYHQQFITVANYFWNTIPEEKFCNIISLIACELQTHPQVEQLQILKEFWDASPDKFKVYLMQEERFTCLIHFFDSLENMTPNLMLFHIWKGTWP
ncbi:uncharacterized protein LOC129960872 [Argiope bruennichi]|uniref:Uncharacterized protein n=1 Tax=Argiope bruennichi TaxID=94029 RepID=A0A8T0FNU5_ARGBR|nr:uncharacterized protein LOC129960872 [Argiope bruennichi]XP_055930553.1 uncharacterized protein LOC129960872 [Argiope bruennichi]XP_055930554.1 uncharacterized protein LOC129960872 [Argiope bruennichi]KAF8791289.1 hypothetical protein HNY73_006177 [Argiope bruennichi]